MHYITEIKDIGKKCRIIIDDDIVVQLYKGEVRKLGIKADSQFRMSLIMKCIIS